MATKRAILSIAATMVLAAACTGDLGGENEGILGQQPGDGNSNTGQGEGPGDGEEEKTILDERQVDYFEALRLASIKLRDITPSLQRIEDLKAAADPRAAYEDMIDDFFEDPRYQQRMIRFWRDTFRMGGGMLNTAPTFAARVMVEGRPYSDLFTATSGTCPSYDADTQTFVDGDCDNGVTVHAGVLTNPGVMSQFYGNMAFRRVRWVQEMFACTKFPAEYSDNPVAKGEGQYTSPWNFESIGNEPIDFQDTSAVICANCHTSMNHIAPLFANFDADGNMQGGIQVETPIAPDPVTTEISHWLQPGETTAWRLGVPAETLPELGEALASDPEVMHCMTARLWNFTMSKEDIVSDLAVVQGEVIDAYVNQLANNGGDLKDVLRSMMKSEDFVSF